jgi:uncharacterized protein (TIGR02646 family)
MIKLPTVDLDRNTVAKLAEWQAEVDINSDYSTKVAAAKSEFGRRNTATNPTFKAVKAALTQMCAGARRCVYCEDSLADEVEHIAPKDLYPERVFLWDNYVYACGPCNGPKNNKYAVIDSNGMLVVVTRPRGAPVVPPAAGVAEGIVNPRVEDPTYFFELDIIDTFVLLRREQLPEQQALRADYTIELLDLNKDVLLAARENAYRSYRGCLRDYAHMRDNGASGKVLDFQRRGILQMPHPTVLAEMRRSHAVIPELIELFQAVPEALDW